MPFLVCTVSGRLHPERVRRRPRLGRCRQGAPSPGGEPERVARRCRDVSRTRPSKRCTGERPPGCQPARVDRRWLGPRTPCKRRPRVLSPDGAPVRVERPCDSFARLRVERPRAPQRSPSAHSHMCVHLDQQFMLPLPRTLPLALVALRGPTSAPSTMTRLPTPTTWRQCLYIPPSGGRSPMSTFASAR